MSMIPGSQVVGVKSSFPWRHSVRQSIIASVMGGGVDIVVRIPLNFCRFLPHGLFAPRAEQEEDM